jgi:hypothetical protein
MTEPFDPDVQRFLEILRHKTGFNLLARFKIFDDDNPALKSVRYQTAPSARTSGWEAPETISGEMKVNADLIGRIFRIALAHEDSPMPFLSSRMVFYDVVDYKHENYRAFVLLFLSTDIL